MSNILSISIEDLSYEVSLQPWDQATELKPYSVELRKILGELKQLTDQIGAGRNKTLANDILVHTQMALSAGGLIQSVAVSKQGKNPVIQKISAWVSSNLILWLQSLWSSVWAVIQTLTTPKEWKLSGEVGSSMLGLANAKLEVSFG